MRRLIVGLTAVVVLVGMDRGRTSGFTTIDVPGTDHTHVYAIDGDRIGGYYNAAGGSPHGFVFHGSTLTLVDVPGSFSTAVYSMDGGLVIGSCNMDATRSGGLKSQTQSRW